MQASTDKGPASVPFGRTDPSLPQVFGRYLLVQRLSRGGMGEIFLAKHGLQGFEKLAVIKKVLPHLAADAQFISRFVDEAQVAIKLQHVNVAQVFEVGRVGDEYFLALEYVEGRDLRRTLALLGHRKQRLPVDLALFIGRELANGLAYAHRRTASDGSSLNLVHCDISPPNVLCSFEGETKVIDFGIAKSAIRGTATDPKMGFGKFGYMAPEQLIRGGIVDYRTDIYAAGVVLYELLTGQRLYEAGPEPDYRALAKKVAKGEHPMPSETAPELGTYDDLVATALRPRPEDRYQSAAEFRDAIQQCLVAVNPTISTDQLGLYMRDLFADEMAAQREMHDRVARVHVADFQEQFHTQTISTVSFALAQLPLQAPPEPDAPKVASRPRGATQPPPISPALDTVAPPTAALEHASATEELSLADGTGTASRVEKDRPRRRGIIVAFSLGIVLVGAFAFAMGQRSGEPSAPPTGASPGGVPAGAATGVTQTQIQTQTPQPSPTATASAANPKITVEEIRDPDPIPQPSGSAHEIEMAADPTPSHSAEPHRPRVHEPAPHHSTASHEKHDGSAAAPAVAISRADLGLKWKAVTREYDAYKSQNGTRYDADFSDLATFMQFQAQANLDEASRRIDAFRTKLH
ncbi:MAG TPA: protein kinase [Kofleriaceae bacterium]